MAVKVKVKIAGKTKWTEKWTDTYAWPVSTNPAGAVVQNGTTAAPTGLTVTRSNNVFKATFKIGDSDYSEGVQIQFRFNGGVWQNAHYINNTSGDATFAWGNFYPYKSTGLRSVEFRARGKKVALRSDSWKRTVNVIKGINKTTLTKTVITRYAWSAWAQAGYYLYVPNACSIGHTLDENYPNKATYSWSSANNTEHQPHWDYEYQSILVKESNVADGSKLSWSSSALGWQTGTGGSVTITESNSTLATGSHTRWVRARARGAAGASDWRYTKHVYASPYSATNVRASAIKGQTSYSVSAYWSTPSTYAHPVDDITLQYSIVTPTGTGDAPSSASWNDVQTLAPKSGADGLTFSVAQVLNVDEALFVRVTTRHDKNNTYSAAARAATGYLSDPTGLSVSLDHTTHRATITATNASSVADSFLAITYRPTTTANAFVCGIIPKGQTSITVQAPDWSAEEDVAFEVRAYAGTYTAKARTDGATAYSLNTWAESQNSLQDGGSVPTTPTNVTASATDTPGTIRVTWDWSWAKATKAVISWADHADAWESTSEPSKYEISNLHAASWNISNLEPGQKWYIRVQLVQVQADGETPSPWSEIVEVDLASAPSIPTLILDKSIIGPSDSVTAAWGYVSTDGTPQAAAEICEATITGLGIEYGEIIARTQTAQHITLNPEELGWTAGTTYNLCVRVVSRSGKTSDSWSLPVSVTIAEPLTATITQHSLVAETVDEREILSLKELPLTVTVTGAGYGGTTMVAIEYAAPYSIRRPDDTNEAHFEGETVALLKQTGEDEITIDAEHLNSQLNDDALYRIVATVQDGFGQSAETTLDFEVHWTEQAIIPTGEVELDEEHIAAFITPLLPEGAENKGTADIYRLSADKPELIVKDAEWGTKYVDPFPAIGELSGHRIVYKSENGDYITPNNELAFADIVPQNDFLRAWHSNLIHFGEDTLELPHNISIKNQFEKDFTETQYLGGSVVGDWNPAIKRSSTLDATVYLPDDDFVLRTVRALSRYTGICQIRMMDGSSFSGDVQVSDALSADTAGKLLEVGLSIARVDPEQLDGLTYDEWIEANGGEG